MRIALCIEYDGSRFHGWQQQPGTATVQQHLAQAVSFVADQKTSVTAAGRTDTGVHASAQIVHFDTTAQRHPYGWIRGINTRLPVGIAALWAQRVDDDFHARFKAVSRHYRYIILNRSIRPTYLAGKVTWEYRLLQRQPMLDASRYFLGEHDFSAFRASSCQAKSPWRTVTDISIGSCRDWLWMDIQASGFLHHMVRNIAGSLLMVASGEQTPCWIEQVLRSGDRCQAGPTAPADGLYLTGVEYDAKYGLPDPPPGCRYW
ncbi:MAG TPA: tRNA pseudouridine(38-40) synthase TruA [Gammaproteobacteria bacterium]|nr:tRNA pseudouridine(38-40) synthase TruA [Gammaproteobacteria bacterium]